MDIVPLPLKVGLILLAASPSLGGSGGDLPASPGLVMPETLHRWPARIRILVGPTRAVTRIQDGINQARDGDVLLVDPGTYHESLDLGGKRIAIIGRMGPEVTILDGRDCPRGGDRCSTLIFTSGEGPRTWIEGFTIHGDKGTAASWADRALLDPWAPRREAALGAPRLGGAVLVDRAGPTLARCVITGGQATHGGGVAVVGERPWLVGRWDAALGEARAGGGASAAAVDPSGTHLRLIDVEIVDNLAYLSGGGIFVDGAEVTMSGGRISGNEALDGGAVSAAGASLWLNGVEMLKDRAGRAGGALFLVAGSRVVAVESALVEGWATDGALSWVEDSQLELDGGWVAFPRGGPALASSGDSRISGSSLTFWPGDLPATTGEARLFSLPVAEVTLEDPGFLDLRPDRSWRDDDLGAWREGDPSGSPSVQVFVAAIAEEGALEADLVDPWSLDPDLSSTGEANAD